MATTGSANTVPHSATLRFDLISIAPVSYRRLTSWKGRVRFQRQVAEFVDNQQLRLGQREQFRVQTPFAMRLGKTRD
ncbi:hypothetical protein ACVIW2_004231 [Bradyrhizobium huanghuaihaiense]|uniref:Uncharacterized protein n=3 Tax=Bradyrhizobium TaxID=374 RepID=A0A810CJ53_9BRAD|nr:hypothetical protein BJA5080_07575 [Bradyrhizobium diazoefficiens SEMIA 5080]TWI58221.1 hypothetical protein IQ16_08252 [Bradyrhizobium huanghuaihaiense]BBZ92400.1 hypothetical protein F07S3_22330 [Bradyrhizobium diazoefficiens]BCA10149.1 hypothetical protein BDHF08_19960 [Bradyrhizobium diazoefficiens]BCE19365.1 hypothetical protein XF1B_20460 [Bradyrhizobium diazoefficiens]